MRPTFKPGDRVLVVRVPADIDTFTEEATKWAFRFALDKTYTVRGTNEVGWLEIELGDEADRVLGGIGNSIWIEPDCVEAAE